MFRVQMGNGIILPKDFHVIHENLHTYDRLRWTCQSPFDSRYCSAVAKLLASEGYRWMQIRYVWLCVLRAQLGYELIPNPPSDDAVREFEEKIGEFDWEVIGKYESELVHDVDSHRKYIVTDLVPDLGPVIHLGLTSQDPQCNGELLAQREWLRYLRGRLVQVINAGVVLAERHANTPCIGETHLLEATPITFGHRVTMWLGPLLDDLDSLDFVLGRRHLKGIHGATGVNEAMLELCHGDDALMDKLLQMVEHQLGAPFRKYPVGQTYPRSMDAEMIGLFASICSNLAKIAFDIRLMTSTHEVSEPKRKSQKGSSAMPFKENPMKCERTCGLARIPAAWLNAIHATIATQGLERTLDDSAIRRFTNNESFLATDACLMLMREVLSGLNVFPAMMMRRLKELHEFMASEDLIVAAVQHGGSRDTAYDELRNAAKEGWEAYKDTGDPTQIKLVDRITANPDSVFVTHSVPMDLKPIGQMTGVSVAETNRFCDQVSQLLGQPANRNALMTMDDEKTKV